jgi:inhibitor of KinA
MRLEPLGDQAVMAYCADERSATRLAEQVRRGMPVWGIDVVQAYVSVALFYDVATVDFAQVADWLAQLPPAETTEAGDALGRLHVVPCCYAFGLDFERIQEQSGLQREEIIALHCGAIYTVYAIGFCPGFPYLGYLPPKLTGMPRLASPRVKVEAGSVGLTGRQTGVYTEVRPGGWNIVGRTPLQLVDVKEGYFPLRTGDRVQFRPIDESEFRAREGERLA